MAGQVQVSYTGVNFRKEASMFATKLGYISPSTKLNYTGTQNNGGYTWYNVNYNGKSGWVCGYNVKVLSSGGGSQNKDSGTTSSKGSIKVNSKGGNGVNLRASAGLSGNKIGFVPAGTTMSYTGTAQANGYTWFNVTYGGKNGWVCGFNVDKVEDQKPSTEDKPAQTEKPSGNATETTMYTTDSVNVRKTPNGTILTCYSPGTKVTVIGKSGDWSKIKYGSGEAYMFTKYLTTKKPAESAPPTAVGGWTWPTDTKGAYISSPYGPRESFTCTNGQKTRPFHTGIDIAGVPSSPIYAAKPGSVYSVKNGTTGYGKTVVVAHDGGTYTRYAHMSSIAVSEGQKVNAGAKVGVIGKSGNVTGIHLHFGYYVGGLSEGSNMDPGNSRDPVANGLKKP